MKLKILTTRQPDDLLPLSGRDAVLQRIIDFGLLGLLVFSPLPAASVFDWSILVIQLVVLALVGCYVAMNQKPRVNPYLAQMIKGPERIFFILAAFVAVQMIPWPKFLVRVLSPAAYAFRKQFTPGFDGFFMSFSMIPSATLRKALEILTFVLVGFLVIRTVTHWRQIRRIIFTLMVMGVFEAFYGLFELSSKNPRILFYKKTYNLDSVTGTFINRNHLSGYLEMIIPLAIGLVLSRLDLFLMSGKKWKAKILGFFGEGFAPNVLLTAGIVVMALGIVFSKSRSGVFLLVFSFIMLIEMSVLTLEAAKPRQQGVKDFLKIVFSIVTVISLFIGLNATISRFALDKLLQEGRPLYWSRVVTMIGNYPLFGTGLGTFGAVYSAYEPLLGGNMVLTHAHNDYLEFLSDLGVPAAMMLFGAVFWIGIRSFLICKERRNPEVKGLGIGALTAVTLILIHSFTDFNLQIPANLLLFSVVLSLAAVIVHHKKTERPKFPHGEAKVRRP